MKGETSPAVVDLVAAADAAVKATDEVQDLALELSELLESFLDLDPFPRWAFPLARYAERVTHRAGLAHGDVLRLRSALRLANGLPRFPSESSTVDGEGGDE